MADIGVINAQLTQAAHTCGWGINPMRRSTTSPFGARHDVASVSRAIAQTTFPDKTGAYFS
jgi:hypothetical protein